MVDCSNQTCQEVCLSKYLHLSSRGHFKHPCTAEGQARGMQKTQCSPKLRRSPAGFFFEIHKNIENMDCTTGFRWGRSECVWSQAGAWALLARIFSLLLIAPPAPRGGWAWPLPCPPRSHFPMAWWDLAFLVRADQAVQRPWAALPPFPLPSVGADASDAHRATLGGWGDDRAVSPGHCVSPYGSMKGNSRLSAESRAHPFSEEWI